MPKIPKKQAVWILLALVLLGSFVTTRYTPFTTYIPFSGRIFSLESGGAEQIFIQNGTTGKQVFFESDEEKTVISRQLGELRYTFWFPALPVAKGGWSYRIALMKDGRQYSYYFSDRYLTVNGIVYRIPPQQLAQLRQYVD